MSQQSGPEMRIGDAEREAAVTALGEHFAAGRLTKEEYDERAGQAWAARTASALWPLFADLPRPQSPRPDPAAAGPRSSGQPGGGRGHDPAPLGWLRTAVLPVFLVLVGLTVLTHLPVILLALVVFLIWAKLGRHRARHWHHHAGYRYSDHRDYGDWRQR